MYTAVLMIALTAGSDSVEHGRRNRCSSGCFGSSVCSGYYGGGWGHGGGCSRGHVGGFYGGGCCSSYSSNYYSPGGYMPGRSEPVPIPGGRPISMTAPATIIVNLPADARLTVNGAPTASTGTSRQFVSPPLESGPTFVYQFRAEVMHNGQPMVETREVSVRAGQTTIVDLTTMPGVASR